MSTKFHVPSCSSLLVIATEFVGKENFYNCLVILHFTK